MAYATATPHASLFSPLTSAEQRNLRSALLAVGALSPGERFVAAPTEQVWLSTVHDGESTSTEGSQAPISFSTSDSTPSTVKGKNDFLLLDPRSSSPCQVISTHSPLLRVLSDLVNGRNEKLLQCQNTGGFTGEDHVAVAREGTARTYEEAGSPLASVRSSFDAHNASETATAHHKDPRTPPHTLYDSNRDTRKDGARSVIPPESAFQVPPRIPGFSSSRLRGDMPLSPVCRQPQFGRPPTQQIRSTHVSPSVESLTHATVPAWSSSRLSGATSYALRPTPFPIQPLPVAVGRDSVAPRQNDHRVLSPQTDHGAQAPSRSPSGKSAPPDPRGRQGLETRTEKQRTHQLPQSSSLGTCKTRSSNDVSSCCVHTECRLLIFEETAVFCIPVPGWALLDDSTEHASRVMALQRALEQGHDVTWCENQVDHGRVGHTMISLETTLSRLAVGACTLFPWEAPRAFLVRAVPFKTIASADFIHADWSNQQLRQGRQGSQSTLALMAAMHCLVQSKTPALSEIALGMELKAASGIQLSVARESGTCAAQRNSNAPLSRQQMGILWKHNDVASDDLHGADDWVALLFSLLKFTWGTMGASLAVAALGAERRVARTLTHHLTCDGSIADSTAARCNLWCLSRPMVALWTRPEEHIVSEHICGVRTILNLFDRYGDTCFVPLMAPKTPITQTIQQKIPVEDITLVKILGDALGENGFYHKLPLDVAALLPKQERGKCSALLNGGSREHTEKKHQVSKAQVIGASALGISLPMIPSRLFLPSGMPQERHSASSTELQDREVDDEDTQVRQLIEEALFIAGSGTVASSLFAESTKVTRFKLLQGSPTSNDVALVREIPDTVVAVFPTLIAIVPRALSAVEHSSAAAYRHNVSETCTAAEERSRRDGSGPPCGRSDNGANALLLDFPSVLMLTVSPVEEDHADSRQRIDIVFSLKPQRSGLTGPLNTAACPDSFAVMSPIFTRNDCHPPSASTAEPPTSTTADGPDQGSVDEQKKEMVRQSATLFDPHDPCSVLEHHSFVVSGVTACVDASSLQLRWLRATAAMIREERRRTAEAQEQHQTTALRVQETPSGARLDDVTLERDEETPSFSDEQLRTALSFWEHVCRQEGRSSHTLSKSAPMSGTTTLPATAPGLFWSLPHKCDIAGPTLDAPTEESGHRPQSSWQLAAGAKQSVCTRGQLRDGLESFLPAPLSAAVFAAAVSRCFAVPSTQIHGLLPTGLYDPTGVERAQPSHVDATATDSRAKFLTFTQFLAALSVLFGEHPTDEASFLFSALDTGLSTADEAKAAERRSRPSAPSSTKAAEVSSRSEPHDASRHHEQHVAAGPESKSLPSQASDDFFVRSGVSRRGFKSYLHFAVPNADAGQIWREVTGGKPQRVLPGAVFTKAAATSGSMMHARLRQLGLTRPPSPRYLSTAQQVWSRKVIFSHPEAAVLRQVIPAVAAAFEACSVKSELEAACLSASDFVAFVAQQSAGTNDDLQREESVVSRDGSISSKTRMSLRASDFTERRFVDISSGSCAPDGTVMDLAPAAFEAVRRLCFLELSGCQGNHPLSFVANAEFVTGSSLVTDTGLSLDRQRSAAVSGCLMAFAGVPSTSEKQCEYHSPCQRLVFQPVAPEIIEGHFMKSLPCYVEHLVRHTTSLLPRVIGCQRVPTAGHGNGNSHWTFFVTRLNAMTGSSAAKFDFRLTIGGSAGDAFNPESSWIRFAVPSDVERRRLFDTVAADLSFLRSTGSVGYAIHLAFVRSPESSGSPHKQLNAPQTTQCLNVFGVSVTVRDFARTAGHLVVWLEGWPLTSQLDTHSPVPHVSSDRAGTYAEEVLVKFHYLFSQDS